MWRYGKADHRLWFESFQVLNAWRSLKLMTARNRLGIMVFFIVFFVHSIHPFFCKLDRSWGEVVVKSFDNSAPKCIYTYIIYTVLYSLAYSHSTLDFWLACSVQLTQEIDGLKRTKGLEQCRIGEWLSNSLIIVWPCCGRKRRQWQSPKRSLDVKGEGAVLNFALGTSEYLGCWMLFELGNQQLIAFSAHEWIDCVRSLHGPLRQPQRQLLWRNVKCICDNLFCSMRLRHATMTSKALESTYCNPNDFNQSAIPNSLPRSEIIITDKTFKVQQITFWQTFEQRLKESAKPATPSQPPAGW